MPSFFCTKNIFFVQKNDNRVRHEKRFRTISIQCPVLKKGLLFASLHIETRPSKMEIYHRDNWIIIVHTATWKDLTKWNEENTIIDWNNYVGRIVKHVFPMLSRLRREGQRMKKITGFTMHYFISLYQV